MFGYVSVAITYMPQRAGRVVPKAIHDCRLRALNTSHTPGFEKDSQVRMGNFTLHLYVVDDISRQNFIQPFRGLQVTDCFSFELVCAAVNLPIFLF
jgi:hypothetical protein